MLTPISELGKEVGDDIERFLDPIKAKQVIAIELYVSDGKMTYGKLSLEEVKESRKYLYKRLSGKPGLFLSWRVSYQDVQDFKKAIKENDMEKIDDFRAKKLEWFIKNTPKGRKLELRIAGSENLKKSKLLGDILSCLAKHTDEIFRDFKSKIEEMDKPQELLITVKVLENGNGKYPGDYDEFTEAVKAYVLG